MPEFPQNLDKAIHAIAKELKLRLAKETHYEAINRELSWFEGKVRKRIDITLLVEHVAVFFHKDRFPFFPKLLLWFYDNIPEFFPYPAKGEWEALDKLPLEQSEEFYRKKIESYIEYSRRK